MLRGGLIIRLIDVVLIILLGFLGIADFEVQSQIKLPSNIEAGKQEIKQYFLFLTIRGDNLFELVQEDNEVRQVEGFDVLEQLLIQLNNHFRQNFQQLVVVIEPDLESKIQTTVDIMDICEKNQILKSLSYSQIGLN